MKWKLPSEKSRGIMEGDTYCPFNYGVLKFSIEQAESDLTDALDMLEEAEKIFGTMIPMKHKIKDFLNKFR